MSKLAPWLIVSLLAIQPAAVRPQSHPPKQASIPGVFSASSRIDLIRGSFHGLEGPMPTPDGGLYFSAIDENKTYMLATDGKIAVWRENTNGTNGLYLLKDGRLLGAARDSVIAVSADLKVSTLASNYAGRPLRSPNDLIPDRKGGIYFTDPAPRPASDVAPKEPGNVYYLRPNGTVVLLDEQIARPNGITLSLDQKTLYVDDTEGEYVYAFDVQPDGSVKNRREFVKLHDPEKGSLGLRSRADGMAMDSAGRLYIATAAGLQVIDPNGKHLGIIRTPEIVRNLAFAGSKRHTLYMTAVDALYRVEMLSQGPVDRAK